MKNSIINLKCVSVLKVYYRQYELIPHIEYILPIWLVLRLAIIAIDPFYNDNASAYNFRQIKLPVLDTHWTQII